MPVSSVRVISATSQKLDPNSPEKFRSSWSQAWKRVAPFALIFLAACTLFFAELGKYPLFNPDEALYAEPAREMLEIGDYITTYLNYVVRFTKPPVAIWGQAISILVFGCNEFAVRFFGAASGALLVAATYWTAEILIGRRAAIVSSLALCTAPLFVGTAREAITDMPLSFFSAASMFCFFMAIRLQKPPLLYLAYALTGLAVMTKGPVGVVLPVGILAVYHFLKQDWKEALRFYRPLSGIAIVGLISLPWFITEIVITGGAYFNDFIMKENFQRFTSVVDSHKGAWWYHIAAMMGGFFPWSVFVPQAILTSIMWDKLRARWTNSGPLSILHSYRGLTLSEDLGLYCSCWALVTLAFYSISVSKLLPYTLPAFPAIAVIIALEFERIISEQSAKRALVPVLILALIFAAATLVLPHTVKLLRDAPETLVDILGSFASYQLIFTAAAAALISRRFFRSGFYLFLIPTFVGFLFFGNRLLTVLSQTWEAPLPPMARFAAGSDLPIIVYDMRKPSMPFYTHRQVIQPSSPDQLKSLLADCQRGAYILSKSKQAQFFRELPGCFIQCAEGRFVLVRYLAKPSKKENKTALNSKFAFH